MKSLCVRKQGCSLGIFATCTGPPSKIGFREQCGNRLFIVRDLYDGLDESQLGALSFGGKECCPTK
jgi:hypothetical protein